MSFTVYRNLRRWLSSFLILNLLLSAGLTLEGCNPLALKTEAAQVSQIVFTILGDPKTFNYALNQEFPNVFLFTMEGLTAINYTNGAVEPALAESWQISADKKRVVFTLREGLKWSDGAPLTADDVVFTYNDIVFNQDIPNDAKDTIKIGSSSSFPKVQKLDERRVEFILPEPFAPFLRITAGAPDGIGLYPKHILAESIKSKDSNGKPKFVSSWGTDTNPSRIVVNGPYQIESYTPSQRIIFRRNPYYWRKDDQGNSQPYIERIVWQIVENTDTALIQFRSGDLDISEAWGRMPPEHYSLLKREEKRGNFKTYSGGQRPGTNFISFNLNKGKRNGKSLIEPSKSRWFNTVEFRQAIAYAIDRQTLLNNTVRGLGELQNSPITVQSPYYLSPKEGLRVYDYNPQKAKELLQKAGFKYSDNNHLFDADGNPVRFTLITNAENKTRVAMGAQIKHDLSQIGIQVDFNPIAFNTLTDKLSNTLDWECYLLGFTGGVEPNDGANVWSVDGGQHNFNQKPQSGQLPVEGREVSAWEIEINRLYIEAAKELDEEKRKAIYAQTQRITQEYLPMIYLVNGYSMSAIRDRVKGIKYSALGGVVWNIYELNVSND